MSGTLPQYRPGNKPLFIGGQAVYRTPDGNLSPLLDSHNIKRTLRPGGTWKNGRCVEYTVQLDLRQVHVLDYTPEYHRPSKHARGRIRPRTKAERTRARNLQARFTQISKSHTVDHNTLRAIHDEVAA